MAKETALFILQFVALAIPSMVAIIKQMRDAGNLGWDTRQEGFLSAVMAIALFLATAFINAMYLIFYTNEPLIVKFGLFTVAAGMAPFLYIMRPLYKNFKANFGP